MKWFKKENEEDVFDQVSVIQEEPMVEYKPSSYEIVEDIHSQDFFGKLQPLIDDIQITDINCNSHSTWVNHISKGRYEVKDIIVDNDDLEKLAYKISNVENKQFNVVSPILEADFNDLRLQFTHASFSTSGTSMSIRKTPCIARMDEHKMESQDYCSKMVIDFFKYSIKSHLNFFIIGMTGDGKTELAKFLASYIPEYERIITIEDTNELHLSQLYPKKDIVELKVNERVDYNQSIKSCMRMLPNWILLSEARSYEVKELLKSISTGANIITTLHTDKVSNIPKRILNMLEGNELSNDKIENMIYQSVDVGIRVKADVNDFKTYRYISEIGLFWLDENNNRHFSLVYEVIKRHENYYVSYHPLPDWLKDRYSEYNVQFEWKEE